MLVLSRHEGEGVVVPDLDLAIHILKVAGGRIQIGIQAPDCIRVLRSELVERTKKWCGNNQLLTHSTNLETD